MLDEFKELALLTDVEIQILESRIKGWSRTKQSIEFNMSLSTVDRIYRTVRDKYDQVYKLSNNLPMRKKI